MRAALAERGSVTIHAAGVAVVLVLLVAVVVQGAQLVRLRHGVAAAADLAALAGAAASVRGDDGCVAARVTARRNGARLTSCQMDYDVATVTARAVSDPWWGKRWVTQQRARAAPASYVAGEVRSP